MPAPSISRRVPRDGRDVRRPPRAILGRLAAEEQLEECRQRLVRALDRVLGRDPLSLRRANDRAPLLTDELAEFEDGIHGSHESR